MEVSTQIWPTKALQFPGFSFQTGATFGTVIRLGPSWLQLTLQIGNLRKRGT